MTSVYKMPSGLIRQLRYFSWQPQVEADFSRGIIRDLPRSSIPSGGVYDSVDFLLDQPGVARKRGGTSYQSSALDSTGGVRWVAAVEYPVGSKIVAEGPDRHLYDCTPSTCVDRGAFVGSDTYAPPTFFVDKLIVTDAGGTAAPAKITNVAGTLTQATLGGTPPAGSLSAAHISRIVLANSAANPNRAWFSPVPNVESTWDTANAYVDFNHSLSALASVQGVLLGFSKGATERLVGDVPPGTTGENMRLQPLGQIGCADPRSVCSWGSMIVFASQEGVYVTNGAGFDSLTEKSDGTGILSYWRQQYPSATAIVGGILNRNYYFLTLIYSGSTYETFICYLPRKAWMRTANIPGYMYAPSLSGADELYAASLTENRILKLSGCLVPTAANKNDADGTAVAPVLQFRMSGTGVGQKAYGDGHLTYDMRDAATDNPSLAVQISTGIEAEGSFAAVAESPLGETTVAKRKRFTVSKDAQAVNVKVAQTNASSKTEIYLLEVDQRPYELEAEA